MPAELRTPGEAAKRICAAIDPMSFARRPASSRFAIASGSRVASLLSSRTHSALDSSTPAFTAPANPRFSASAITRASGKRAAIRSDEPSPEPLSTAISSAGSPSRSSAASSEARHSIVSPGRRWLTTIAETAVASAAGAALIGRRGRSVRPGAPQDDREGLGEDAEVARQRQVLDVVELDREALREGQLAAAEDLHRPRHAGLDLQ